MSVLYRRLGYMLTPQLTIYQNMKDIAKDKFVLEIGSGTGFGVVQYAGVAKQVTAIDIDRDAIAFSKWALPLNNVDWEVGDICCENLGRYDLIVMIEVIEHIPNWQHALDSIKNLLIPGGTLIISTPNANGTFIKNELHGDEWTANEFYQRLNGYFGVVQLYDFTLKNKQTTSTKQTPLVAVCCDKEA